MGDTPLTVDTTPHGLGDAVLRARTPDGESEEELFVKPMEQQLTLCEFLSYLRAAKPGPPGPYRECDEGGDAQALHGAGIPYLSHQNDNLRQQLGELTPDVPRAVDFVKEVSARYT